VRVTTPSSKKAE